MQVVGYRDVHDIHVGRAEQFLVILGQQLDGGNLPEPVEEFVLQVAHGDQLGLHRKVFQHEPARKGAGGLTAHQATANDTHPHHVAHQADSMNSGAGRVQASHSRGGLGSPT